MRFKILHGRTALEIEEALNDFYRKECGSVIEHFAVTWCEGFKEYTAVLRYLPQ